MTTGAPLYLVSACASAEEFVAAFRRYADRTGLFVPIADPLPQGRRGRIALTLNDGRILLEGEVEVATASARPSPLYGRVGMTLKFVEPDDATKTALGELEKARLAMKPAPLSVVPRASDVAATPRPTPPPIGGRIDGSNALAECVAIGDLSAWSGGAAEGPGKVTETSSGKFVIPTIPQMGAPRPKSPSVPPALQPKVAPEPKPPPVPGTPPPIALPPKIVTPPIGVPSSKAEQRMTTMGMPAIDRLPAIEPKPELKPDPEPKPEMPVISATVTKQGITPPPMATTMGMTPIVRAPEPVVPRRDPTPLPKKGEAVQIPKREVAVGKQTTLGMPIVRLPADTQESPAPPPPTPASTGAAAARRAHTPSTPPAPRHPTPYAPLPIVRKPASDAIAPLVDLSETTDVTEAPEPPLVGEEQRKTSLGVSRLTASPVAPAETNWDDESKPTEQQAAVESPLGAVDVAAPSAPSRSGGLRASEIMAAMKGEDWTMTPDASSPTVLPKPADPATDPSLKAAEEKSGPLPGDWAISLDPASPGGWSKPAKVEKPPELKAPAAGNRNIAVASAQAIEAVEWEEKPTGIGEALVQIDPTLMEPAQPMPIDDEEPVNIVSTPIVDVPPPATLPPPFGMPSPLGAPIGIPTPPPWAANATNLPLAAPAPTPVAQPPALPPPPLGPPPRLPTPPPQPSPLFAPPVPNSSAVFPAMPARVDITDGNTNFFRDSGEVPQYSADPTDSIATKRRKRTMFLVIAAAALAVLATVVVILTTGGKKHHATPHHAATTTGSGSGSGSGSTLGSDQITTGSAHVETPAPPPVDAAPPAPQVCNVEITTTPTGAELSLDDKTVIGTAPATVQLPCGVETKIHATKAKYGTTVKAFTASADNTKLALRISAPMFSLKVTSMPEGATITVAGKTVGITPTTVKVQAFASTRITLTKDGFTPDTETIAPRVNNAAHHVVLKHATRQKLR